MAQHLDLSFPAKGAFLFLARIGVGAAASQVGLTLEDLEDLHLAVDELCMLLIGPDDTKDERLDVRVEWDDEALSVHCRLTPEPDAPGSGSRPRFGDQLSERILDALVDEHGLGEDGGVPTGFLRKRLPAPPGA